MKHLFKIVAFAVPVVVLGVLIAWRLNAKKQEVHARDKAAQARKSALPNVTVAAAVQRDIVHTYEAVGSIESPFNVKLAAKLTGRIDYLQVREGDPVTKDQPLVRIDPSEVNALVAQQRSEVAQAQQRLSQAQLTTGSTNVGIATQIAQQQAGLASAQADYDQVRQNYAAQVAAARSVVTDAQARVDTARSAVTNADAMIRSAQANLANAQTRLNRTLDLYKQGFIAAQDVDDARTQVSVQQGALDVARGQRSGTESQVGSAQAQLKSAQEQASIVATKGKADIEAARQKVKQAQAAVSLAVANRSQTPAYQANLRALEAGVTAAQAQLSSAQAQLENTVLRSPIDGFVTARYFDPGATATAGTPLLVVQSLRQVYVTTAIPEEVSRGVKNGQTARVALDAAPGKFYTGRVTQINPAADPQSRQFVVRLTLDNPTGQIRPGMFARVTYETLRIRNAIVIPREAVKTDRKSGQKTVTVIADGAAHARPVETGTDDGANIQIRSGLRAGETVVALSLTPVKDGQKVNATPAGGRGEGQGGAPVVGAGADGASAPAPGAGGGAAPGR